MKFPVRDRDPGCVRHRFLLSPDAVVQRRPDVSSSGATRITMAGIGYIVQGSRKLHRLSISKRRGKMVHPSRSLGGLDPIYLASWIRSAGGAPPSDRSSHQGVHDVRHPDEPRGDADPDPAGPVQARGRGHRDAHRHLGGPGGLELRRRTLVSDTLGGQLVQSFRNVRTGLESVGATFDDLVRVTIYAARWSPDMSEEFDTAIADVRREMGWSPAPLALIGVDILYIPEIRVEVEATAVLP
ncbi:RidA family protein [Actinomadura geliboluensis]